MVELAATRSTSMVVQAQQVPQAPEARVERQARLARAAQVRAAAQARVARAARAADDPLTCTMDERFGKTNRSFKREDSSCAVATRVFVDDVRDKLGEQSVDDAESARHLAGDVQHDERIGAQVAAVEAIEVMRGDA